LECNNLLQHQDLIIDDVDAEHGKSQE